MGKPNDFLKYNRELPPVRNPKERLADSKEIYKDFPEEKVIQQASRCMDCGVPFCHNGCPLGNYIPDFNEAVSNGEWEEAYKILNQTNNFPEFTGRICPAPCESSCVLSINKPSVTIEVIEKNIIEKAFERDMVKADPPLNRTGKKIAVIGSGPAGLAAAAQLNKAGHIVDIYEKDDKAGGLLRYGIPDFKLEKWVIDRRIKILEEEGIRFYYNREIGKDISLKKIKKNYDAVLLCIGATKPRELHIRNSDLNGVYYAMDYLVEHNKRVAKCDLTYTNQILAAGKNVIVIGGGDTGSDCVGTANRQHAASVVQLQYRPVPPHIRNINNPWPEWPMVFTSSSSHEEGCERAWGWLTKEFIRDNKGNVNGLKVVELEWKNDREYFEKENSEKILPCDLALIAIGYERPVHDHFKFNFQLDSRGNFKLKDWKTNIEGVFAAGDAFRGQSLVVWAISDGREAAREIDKYLMGKTVLPSKEDSNLSLTG